MTVADRLKLYIHPAFGLIDQAFWVRLDSILIPEAMLRSGA
jgi:hypothetical protein